MDFDGRLEFSAIVKNSFGFIVFLKAFSSVYCMLTSEITKSQAEN